jgi:hypothetical protein
MILFLLVKPRANRMQDMVASVPLLQKRTFSMLGTSRQIIEANSTSPAWGVPKVIPFPAASLTDATISG